MYSSYPRTRLFFPNVLYVCDHEDVLKPNLFSLGESNNTKSNNNYFMNEPLFILEFYVKGYVLQMALKHKTIHGNTIPV